MQNSNQAVIRLQCPAAPSCCDQRARTAATPVSVYDVDRVGWRCQGWSENCSYLPCSQYNPTAFLQPCFSLQQNWWLRTYEMVLALSLEVDIFIFSRNKREQASEVETRICRYSSTWCISLSRTWLWILLLFTVFPRGNSLRKESVRHVNLVYGFL